VTIYWERCSICGKYEFVKQCTLHPELMVCPHCCLTCPLRSKCPHPAWYPKLGRHAEKEAKREEMEKIISDLLSKLEE
jgi:hypothetical protein